MIPKTPHILSGIGSRFEDSINNVLEGIRDAFMDFTSVAEPLYTLGTTTPAPEVDGFFDTPDSGIWATLYSMNQELSMVAGLFLVLTVILLISGRSLGFVNAYDKKYGLQLSVIGFFLILLNREILAFALNFSAGFNSLFAPTEQEAISMITDVTLTGFIPGAGMVISFMFFLVLGFALTLVLVRDVIIFMIFWLMPILIAVKPLRVGALKKLSRVSDGAIGSFVGLLFFTLPLSVAWQIGIVVRTGNYLPMGGQLAELVYVIHGAGVIMVGVLLGLYLTSMGRTAYAKVTGTVTTTGKVGAAYVTGGSSVALGTALSGGNRHAGRAKAEYWKDVQSSLQDRFTAPTSTAQHQANTNELLDQDLGNTPRRTRAMNWVNERYENGKRYIQQTTTSTPGTGPKKSNVEHVSLFSDYDQTSTTSGNESGYDRETYNSRGAKPVATTTNNTTTDEPKDFVDALVENYDTTTEWDVLKDDGRDVSAIFREAEKNNNTR